MSNEKYDNEDSEKVVKPIQESYYSIYESLEPYREFSGVLDDIIKFCEGLIGNDLQTIRGGIEESITILNNFSGASEKINNFVRPSIDQDLVRGIPYAMMSNIT